MAIDWNITGTALSGWGSVLSALAVLWATHRATGTLDEWKKKRASEREEAHAQECLEAAYAVLEAFEAIRSGWLYAFEMDRARARLIDDPKWQDLTEEQRTQHVRGQVYLDRLHHFDARFVRLAACVPRARAIFGEELAQSINELRRQQQVLTVEIESYVHDIGFDRDFDRKIRNNITDREGTGDGQISTAIRNSMAIIEAKLLAVLRG